jgi:hypothetical protein
MEGKPTTKKWKTLISTCREINYIWNSGEEIAHSAYFIVRLSIYPLVLDAAKV